MIKIKAYENFTVYLLEEEDKNSAWCIAEGANYVVVNNQFDTIDMYEMSEVKALNNAELFNYEKDRQITQATLAASLAAGGDTSTVH